MLLKRSGLTGWFIASIHDLRSKVLEGVSVVPIFWIFQNPDPKSIHACICWCHWSSPMPMFWFQSEGFFLQYRCVVKELVWFKCQVCRNDWSLFNAMSWLPQPKGQQWPISICDMSKPANPKQDLNTKRKKQPTFNDTTITGIDNT